MQIEKFKKDKKNLYKVYFSDDSNYLLYDDVIVKYNLLVNKTFDREYFEEILNYNSFLDGYYRAVKYINSKMRTELEIRKYLKKLCISNKNIDEIINLLINDGYINKEVYLKAYINDQYNLTINGPIKVKKNLIELGYNKSDIDNYLYKFDWDRRIENIILKKIKLNHKNSNNILKIKILNDIIKLGYEKENIVNIMNNISFSDDTEIVKKEVSKLYFKYKLKYEGKEIEYKIINSLYKKGFNIEDIKRCYDEIKDSI